MINVKAVKMPVGLAGISPRDLQLTFFFLSRPLLLSEIPWNVWDRSGWIACEPI